jgi:hypothetical protein
MQTRHKIFVGMRVGRLTVVKCFGRTRRRGPITWECLCDCGNSRIWNSGDIPRKRSCGCGSAEHRFQGTHRLIQSPEYGVWHSMKGRCGTPTYPGFANYGGRGITVCDRWQNSFESFYEDMGPRPSANHSIERIDNEGNYEPGNCRWATRLDQARNKRTNRKLTYKGQTLTISEWAVKTGLQDGTIRKRLNSGQSVERALTAPLARVLLSKVSIVSVGDN